ncbi:hypothetical protein KIN20_034567 [Parelaphostrongylus tenuis]|uniref:Uncharacterized protein n=1 Tax=Parelaphostrongylus tenuis TaxID=148309 RepID=A0AAD5WJA2_PARTN|nr:hypothetical protein KIN20_034567 [Parelaphostrongylus tenuis]
MTDRIFTMSTTNISLCGRHFRQTSGSDGYEESLPAPASRPLCAKQMFGPKNFVQNARSSTTTNGIPMTFLVFYHRDKIPGTKTTV